MGHGVPMCKKLSKLFASRLGFQKMLSIVCMNSKSSTTPKDYNVRLNISLLFIEIIHSPGWVKSYWGWLEVIHKSCGHVKGHLS